jgi:hypothetical protein
MKWLPPLLLFTLPLRAPLLDFRLTELDFEADGISTSSMLYDLPDFGAPSVTPLAPLLNFVPFTLPLRAPLLDFRLSEGDFEANGVSPLSVLYDLPDFGAPSVTPLAPLLDFVLFTLSLCALLLDFRLSEGDFEADCI